MRKRFLFCCSCAAILTIGCGDKQESPSQAPDTDTESAQTFYTDTAKAVFDTRCVSCHSDYHSSTGTVPLHSFQAVSAKKSQIKSRVSAGTMPLQGSAQADQFTAQERQDLIRFTDLVQ